MTAPPSTLPDELLAADPPRATLTVHRRAPSGDRTWLLTLLPAFPILLLVLRVWYLSRQDLPTMLFLLQSANPLGLIASLLISLLWAVPAIVLVLRMLYLLLAVSAAPSRSWLKRAGERTPIWVSAPAVLLASIAWQLRFLPALLMLALVITALEVRLRLGPGRFATALTGTVVPVAAGILALIWLGPAIARALGAGEPTTAALLALPPIAAPLLCGPIPARTARWLLPAVASGLALTTPFLLGQDYLATPVLPRVAVQYSVPGSNGDPATSRLQRGSLVSTDDAFTAVLDDAGSVRFVRVVTIEAQVLCSAAPDPPTSAVFVHGWQVEQSALSWAAPQPREAAPDPRCRS